MRDMAGGEVRDAGCWLPRSLLLWVCEATAKRAMHGQTRTRGYSERLRNDADVRESRKRLRRQTGRRGMGWVMMFVLRPEARNSTWLVRASEQQVTSRFAAEACIMTMIKHHHKILELLTLNY